MISTTDYPTVETTTTAEELYAEYISAPASSMSPAAIAEHLQQNQITFEIPSAHDLRHIDALNSFNALLQRIGNAAVSYDPAPPSGWSPDGSISTEQLSKSVVLDLADLRDRSEESGESSWWSQIFGDADMHVIINYLWIGVVSSLVILSLVFILFSCYFYRKLRTWKKCSKFQSDSHPNIIPTHFPPPKCHTSGFYVLDFNQNVSPKPYLRPFIQLAKQYKMQKQKEQPKQVPPPPIGSISLGALLHRAPMAAKPHKFFGALRNCQPAVCIVLL